VGSPSGRPPHPTTLDVHHSKIALPMSESGHSRRRQPRALFDPLPQCPERDQML